MASTRVFRSSSDNLYLIGGSNEAAALHTAEFFSEKVDSWAWHEIFSNRQKFMASINTKFCQLIVPEKLSIYPLNSIDACKVFSQGQLAELLPPGERLLLSAPHASVVYPCSYLRSQLEQFAVFPKTDSHWTWVGAFSAFQMITTFLSYKLKFSDFVNLPKYTLSYRGDLWEPAYSDIPADTFERVRLPTSIRRVFCNSLVGLKEAQNVRDEAGLHAGSHCIFVNPNASCDDTVMIFGSSFSEYRLEPSLLTSIFTFYFATVHFIWSTSIDFSYVTRHKPDLVVSEMPERFLTSFPESSFNIDAQAATKVRDWNKAHMTNSQSTPSNVVGPLAREVR